jgi:hypothetical protein
MSFFAQQGRHLFSGSFTLVNGTLTGTLYTPLTDEWADAYEIGATTDESAATRTLTISDGTTTLTYFVGGGATNAPLVDHAAVPVRFKKGTAITVSVNAVTAGKHIAVAVRGLTSKT